MTTMGDEKMKKINKVYLDFNYTIKNKNIQTNKVSKPRPKN